MLVADLRAETADAVVAEIRAAGGIAESYVGDSSDPAIAEGAIAAANALAPLKIAVNNAGIGGEANLIGDYSLESWRKAIEINLNAVFSGLKFQLPAIAANGGGAVVNVASVLWSVGIPMSSAYVTAKHGLVGLTKNAALEYGAKKVRTNAVGPGFIRTPLVDANLDSDTQAFLVSDAASFISGSYHLVEGGYAAQ